MQENRSYYGSLEGELKGASVTEYILDVFWERILEKHEEELRKVHNKILMDAKDTFKTRIKEFNEKIIGLNNRIICLEKINKEKEKKDKEEKEKVKEGEKVKEKVKEKKEKEIKNGV